MNICVDTQPFFSPVSRNRGIGNYATKLIAQLIRMDRTNQYILLNLYSDESALKTLNLAPGECQNVVEARHYTGFNHYLIQTAPHGMQHEYNEILDALLRRTLVEYRIDTFFFTSPFDYWHIFKAESFRGVRKLAIVYDVIPLVFQDRYLADKSTRQWYMGIVDFIKTVDLSFAISESVRDDLSTYCGINRERVVTIYSGVDEQYRRQSYSSDDTKSCLARYGIKDSFVLCTGGDDPRKNMAELIEAYAGLSDNLKSAFQLVFVCSITENGLQRYLELIRRFKVEGRVVFTNFIPLEDLIFLYNQANLMAFPSQYEGFGLPVIEAMNCGTPVLTSNNSSLGEIAKDAAILVDPFSIADIRRGLRVALEDLPSLERLSAKAAEKIEQFTWPNTARIVLGSLISLQPLSDGEEERMKLAFFSPIPMQKSGISDYGSDLLSGLAKRFDIDIFVGDHDKADMRPETMPCPVLHHSKYRKKHGEYDRTLYQIGNSEFHTYMFDYLDEFGGDIVLHDYNLHGIVYHQTAAKGNFKEYERILRMDHGDATSEYVQAFRQGECGHKIHDMHVNGFVVDKANRIIVHSDDSKEKLLMTNIGRNVIKIPLYATRTGLSQAEARMDLDLPEEDMILASFGFISRTKRIDAALMAIIDLFEAYPSMKYILVGEAEKEMQEIIERFIQENDLDGRIILTGFTDLETFKRYIAAADICLNLRYPYNGESSASLARIVAEGKPCLVSDIGSFSEYPDDCCFKIPLPVGVYDDLEQKAIHDVVADLLGNKGLREAVSARALKFYEGHLKLDRIIDLYDQCLHENMVSCIQEEALIRLYERHVSLAPDIKLEIQRISDTIGYAKQSPIEGVKEDEKPDGGILTA